MEKTKDLSSNLLAQSIEGHWKMDVDKTIALESPDCLVFASVSVKAKNTKIIGV